MGESDARGCRAPGGPQDRRGDLGRLHLACCARTIRSCEDIPDLRAGLMALPQCSCPGPDEQGVGPDADRREVALVAFEPETGHPDQLTNTNYSGAGIAVLLTAELALRGAVAVVGLSITVPEQRVDDPLLESVRLALAQHPDTDLAQQVRRMSLAIGGAWHEILGRLEQDGLIMEVEPRRPPLHRARYDVDRAARDSVLAEIDRAARHDPADAAHRVPHLGTRSREFEKAGRSRQAHPKISPVTHPGGRGSGHRG